MALSQNKIAKDTNIFLKKYLSKQKKIGLLNAMNYSLFPGGKKIRSKILVDFGKIFNIKYKHLIIIGAAVECIHAYSLIHDDLPCMDNDLIRRGKPSTHVKFGEATAVLAGNSLLTLAFEILSDKNLNINEKTKNILINKLSVCSGHTGIAGGQRLDLNFEKKNIYNILILSVVKHDYIARAAAAHPRFQLILVADDLENPSWVHERNLNFASEFNIPYIKNIDQAFNEHQLDAVIVSSEAERHCDLSIKAAYAGLHIISDKPMSNRISECKRLVKAIKRNFWDYFGLASLCFM